MTSKTGETTVRHPSSLYTVVDVGTTNVCTLIAGRNSDGNPETFGVGICPTRGMSKGTVLDIKEVAFSIASSVKEASTVAGIKPNPVLLGVSAIHLQNIPASATVTESHESSPVNPSDLVKALKIARPQRLQRGRELLHLIPREYILDGTTGIRNPLGMHSRQMGINAQAILGATTPLENLSKAAGQAGLEVWNLVSLPLANGESVLSPEERELGALVVDIGGGTTDLSYFRRGVFWDASYIPLGGHQFTNDIAVVLGVTYEDAESTKLTWGSAEPWKAAPDQTLQLSSLEEGHQHQVSQKELCRIIRERAEELLHLIQGKLESFGLDRLPPAGAILTGGVSGLPGLQRLAKDILGGSVRIAEPRHIQGPSPLLKPASASAIGILQWALRHEVPRRQPHSNRHAAMEKAGRLIQNLASVGIRVSLTSPRQHQESRARQ